VASKQVVLRVGLSTVPGCAKDNFMSMLIGKVEPGDVIGRCRILRELGRGGVGTVYLAKHQTLQIEVALKVLSPALSLDNPALAERFIREAQLAARIRHPNVIAVMDAAHDEPTGLYYIVFEYVGGGALAWHLRNGPLPEARALAVMSGIAQALVVAEENSIVHRDIKPENIMLDARGTAKLADLGLAKHDIDSRTSLTLGGSYMGTPAYMSPEQARDAKAADTRDDIYSLGATFYECLTGEPPFSGETPYNIMSELLTKPSPKVSDRRPDVSRSVDAICRKMMAKTRSLRYGDARALVRDLQHCQTHGDAKFQALEAATFSRDSIMVRQQALQHGVHTPADEVVSDAMTPSPSILRTPRKTEVRPAPSNEEGAFRAAVWLVALVLFATALLAMFGHGFSALNSEMSGPPVLAEIAPAPAAKPDAGKAKPSTHVAVTHKPKATHPEDETRTSPDAVPKITDNTTLIPPRALPVTPPSAFGETNGAPSPVPFDTNVAPMQVTGGTNMAPLIAATNAAGLPLAPPVDGTNLATGTVPAAPQTAFEARDVAEASLKPGLIGPTGHASLLKIIGRRDPSSPEPVTWTFYFYDTSVIGNATYRTVRDGKVVRDGQAITGAVFPWHDDDVLPEDKLRVDSSAALATAETLLPGVAISSSKLEVTRQKDTAPIWNVTLWARDASGNQQELGTAEIVTDTGYVFKNGLQAPGR
jgi:serine/threonine protein kinase